MERLENKSLKELEKIKEKYIKKYCDFNRPSDYLLTLRILDRTIRAKG